MTTLPGNESIPIEDVPLGEAILFETYQQAADQGWIALSWLAPLGEDKDPVDPIPVIFPTTFAPRIGSISPNGRYVLLLELNFPGGIPYIFDRETNEVKPLFEDYPWRGGIGFDWSMDSKKLVFWALDVGLWLIDVETTERIRLTIPDGPVQRASISPTGEQVAFIAASPTSLRALWVIDAVGGEPRWVIDINGSTRNFGWSTEGILYFGSVAGTTKGESSATGPLWVINAEGDQQRSYEIPLIFGFDFEPLLSPDRTQLAFTGLAPEQVPVCAEPGEQRDCLKPFLSVYLLDLTNDKLTNLGNGFNPTWSPDGHRLAFVSRRTAADELWIINTDGTGLRQLTNDGLFQEQGWWLKARE
jgi:Tol biopolymer transport system component